MSMSCRGCLFAGMVAASGGPQGFIQTTCQADRLEIFKESDKCELAPDGFYKLPRFCNLWRGREWKLHHDVESGIESHYDPVTSTFTSNSEQPGSLDLLEKLAREESALTFGFIIKGSKDIDKTINSILDSNYNHDKLRIMLSIDFADTTPRQKRDVMDQINYMKKKSVISKMTMHTTKEEEIIDDECYTPLYRDKCVYIAKIKSGTKIDNGYLSYIDRLINEDLKTYTFFEDSNGVEMIHTGVINKTYLQYRHYDSMCEGLKEMAEKQGSYKRYDKKREIHN